MTISKIKSKNDNIAFSGKFKKGIDKKNNTVTKTLLLLRKKNLLKNNFFKINVKKNIPHGSGLGGGSSNAANLINFLASKRLIKINKKKKFYIARQIGFDVPIILEKKNTLLSGKNEKILRLNESLKLNILVIYPNFMCSTKKIYQKSKKITPNKIWSNQNIKTNKNLINFLIRQNNDLEETVIKLYPEIRKIIKIIKTQKGCYFSRISGSGSSCIGIFSSMNAAISAKIRLKTKFPKYWCAVSKTI